MPVTVVEMDYRLCSCIEGRAGMEGEVRPTCLQKQRREGLGTESSLAGAATRKRSTKAEGNAGEAGFRA